MKYDPYSLTELIRNDDFIAWVRYPDANNEARWQQFLSENPEKRKTVEAARNYVNILSEDTGKNLPSIEQTNKMWRAVESHLHEENVAEVKTDKIVLGWRWLRIAASVALILGISSLSYWYLAKPGGAANEVGLSEVKGQENATIEKVNDTTKPMTILLGDGSSVVLQPGGRLSFSAKENQKKREVTLTGKAFFEIVKNSERPFLVYTDGIATKVLGTSFLIDAPENSEEVKVEVKTGKVSVFALNRNSTMEEREEAGKPELKGVILTGDQKISVSRQSGKPVRSLEVAAEPEEMDITRQLFMFDETPAAEVFSALESAYNVKIVYNKDVFGSCPLNATLIGQPFIDKLTVICAALDAQFEIEENQVIIKGNGCK